MSQPDVSMNIGEQVISSERPLSQYDFATIQDIMKHGTVEAIRRSQENSYPKPHPFETGQPQQPPQVIITDESEKGPDQAKKPTSWVPDQKVAYAGIGGAVTLLLLPILRHYGVELDLTEAGAIATLVTLLVQYLLPEKRS